MAGKNSVADRKSGREQMKCPYCGSERIETGIVWGKTAQTGSIGLQYRSGISIGVAPAYSDLCLECKSIVRSYVLDEKERNWVNRF